MDRQLPGLDHLQANNLFCVGRNYMDHVREMNSAVPAEPMLFLKPNSAILFDGGRVKLPAASSNVHHEVELVAAVGRQAGNISPEEAMEVIAGITVGIDFTARDLQSEAKKSGKPWALSKGFDTFAPVGRFRKPDAERLRKGMTLELQLNGKTVQKGNTADMIFSLASLVSYLSSVFTLQPGDLIFTGTPDGVGPVRSGDRLEALLDKNYATLRVDVA